MLRVNFYHFLASTIFHFILEIVGNFLYSFFTDGSSEYIHTEGIIRQGLYVIRKLICDIRIFDRSRQIWTSPLSKMLYENRNNTNLMCFMV